MMRAKLAAAMGTWRQQAADAKHVAFAGGGAIRRMLNRKLSQAWEQWQQVAAEMKAQQEKQQGIGGGPMPTTVGEMAEGNLGAVGLGESPE